MVFKICLVGCGGMSNYGHGPACVKYAASNPDVELSACCDIIEEKAAQFSKDMGFPRYYADIADMLHAEKPDAVCLICPPELTCKLSCRILELGFPLIMEKPPGMTVEEIDRMIAAADASGAPTQVSFNRRYMPIVKSMKELLDRELPPERVQHVRYELSRAQRADADFSTTAIHAIDTARFLARSDYRSVRFRYREFPEIGTTTANIFMDCVFESGATGSVDFCPVSGLGFETAVVYAHDHTYFLSLPTFNEYDPTGSVRHFEVGELKLRLTTPDLCDSDERWAMTGFYDENACFFDDLRAGKRPEGDLRSARQSVELMQYLRERRTVYEKD
ncbi:MAG: Gfo/Idh/MocA family oxidoreductase [Armatimonadota bacterium]|nr:Gfo/Idh/MocA family oxidoreductase [Armatimonadota bacterium]